MFFLLLSLMITFAFKTSKKRTETFFFIPAFVGIFDLSFFEGLFCRLSKVWRPVSSKGGLPSSSPRKEMKVLPLAIMPTSLCISWLACRTLVYRSVIESMPFLPAARNTTANLSTLRTTRRKMMVYFRSVRNFGTMSVLINPLADANAWNYCIFEYVWCTYFLVPWDSQDTCILTRHSWLMLATWLLFLLSISDLIWQSAAARGEKSLDFLRSAVFLCRRYCF